MLWQTVMEEDSKTRWKGIEFNGKRKKWRTFGLFVESTCWVSSDTRFQNHKYFMQHPSYDLKCF